MNRRVSAAVRWAAPCAVVAMLLSACADVYQSPQKSASRAVGVRAVGVKAEGVKAEGAKDARVAAAARKPAKPSQADTAPAPDVVFDSRRLEGTGTLLLEEIMGLVRQSPRLVDEVGSALRDLKKTAQDITCIGKRIDGRWRFLAGARVQPYICRIGERWLEISADLRVSGERGESYVTVSDIAIKNAKAVKETNPRWTWTDTKPRDWFLD